MKKINSFILQTLILITICHGCSKDSFVRDTDPIIQSSFINTPLIGELQRIKLTEISNEYLLSEIASNKIIISEFQNCLKVNFLDYPILLGYVLPLECSDLNKSRELFAVYNLENNNSLILIREISGFLDELSGKITFRSLDNSFYISTKYVDGIRVKESNSFDEDVNKGWNCTEEEFNEYYQEAKKACQSDWLCDLACAFNPCTIAYLGAAIIACFSDDEESN